MNNINFHQYKLNNKLSVILHQDNSLPVVSVGVMYKVGSKDDAPNKLGFAHFFEHLLFEGTKNIKRGEFFDIVSRHGGRNNAFTSFDKTYYYEVMPSNALEVALWLEAERMKHPIIDEIGIETQRKVIQQEKKQVLTNAPYGKISSRSAINPYIFKNHPYKNTIIGSMKHLKASSTEDFISFKQKYYNPCNAVLVVCGDFHSKKIIHLIEKYFSDIENASQENDNIFLQEEDITQTIKATEYDHNISLPLKVFAYRTPKITDRESLIFDFISGVLTSGKSSRMYKKMVEDSQKALQVLAFNSPLQDHGSYIMGAIPRQGVSLKEISQTIDNEINNLQNHLISEREYQKILNQLQTYFTTSNANMEGIARTLASYYLIQKDTNLINHLFEQYQSVTREEILLTAQKYLSAKKRLELDYLPQH